MKNTDIVVAGAVTGETAVIADNLDGLKRLEIGNRTAAYGEIGVRKVIVMETGPGMVNTAQALTAVLEACTPKLVIQTGCAGVFKESALGIGDIAISTRLINLELGLESENRNALPDPLPFYVIKNQETENIFPVCDKLSEKSFEILCRHFSGKAITIKKGPIVTVSTITATDARADLIFKKYSPLMEEMEGASAAQVSLIYGIPFIAVRSASNYAGKRDTGKWNLPLAFENSSEAVLTLIKELDISSLTFNL